MSTVGYIYFFSKILVLILNLDSKLETKLIKYLLCHFPEKKNIKKSGGVGGRSRASARATANVLRAAIRDGVRAGRPWCRTELDEVDDETYVHDGVPLPE